MKRLNFCGESWLIMNMLNFNPFWADKISVCSESDRPDLYGIACGGFGCEDWFIVNDNTKIISGQKYISRIPNKILELIRYEGCRLLFDMSNEGYEFEDSKEYLFSLLKDLTDAKIPIEQCSLLMQSGVFAESYNHYCDIEDIHDRIKIIEYDFCPRRFSGEAYRTIHNYDVSRNIYKYLDSLNNEIDNYYLCLNFTPRPHRIGIVSWLFGRGLADKGLISFRGIGQRKDGLYQHDLEPPAWFPDQDAVKRGVRALEARGNLQLDLADDEAVRPDFLGAPLELYNRTGFSLVTESDISGGEMRRITEKSFKPIAGLHPFIIFGNPGSLKILRSLGFRTFRPYICEDYDEIENTLARTQAITLELDRILSMTHDEFRKFRNNVSRTVIYNYRHFIYELPTIYQSMEFCTLNSILI